MSGSGTVFEGKLDMNGVQVANDLLMRGGTMFKEVLLRSAKIGGGQLDIRQSVIRDRNGIDLRYANIWREFKNWRQ